MGRSISFMEKLSTGYSFTELGYRDYIAARFLLNNHYILQGLTLASIAVEKYLKAIIVFNLQEREWYNYHFDRFEKLKNLLAKVNSDVTKEFDPVFVAILEKAFKIRYYDNINKDSSLYYNNFILNKENKQYFMEKPDIGFSIYISVGSVVHHEKIVKGGSTRNKYDGQIAEFTEFGPEFIL